jgi:hypothetical protein
MTSRALQAAHQNGSRPAPETRFVPNHAGIVVATRKAARRAGFTALKPTYTTVSFR